MAGIGHGVQFGLVVGQLGVVYGVHGLYLLDLDVGSGGHGSSCGYYQLAAHRQRLSTGTGGFLELFERFHDSVYLGIGKSGIGIEGKVGIINFNLLDEVGGGQ